MKSICVFCGSSLGKDPLYQDVAFTERLFFLCFSLFFKFTVTAFGTSVGIVVLSRSNDK